MTHGAIDKSQKYLMPAYPLQEIVLERGEGCYVYDTDGKQYLDFAAGIAVCSLGHAHPGYVAAALEQMNKIIMCPGSYPTQPRAECAETLIENSCFDQVFFCNSGTEAIEAALKLARKWGHENGNDSRKEIIAFNNSFHGRTYGAMSVTSKAKNQPFFSPYMPGVHFADLNDIDSVKKYVSDKTCAILLEPVQGESGIRPADREFLQALRALCDETGILLIFDEIQCGIGRLGTLFAYEHFDVEPDVACLAKGLGNGYPIGALVMKEKYASCLGGGVHGTTYGGNPLATKLAGFVLKEINSPAFLTNVKKTSAALFEGLNRLKQEHAIIKDVRGIGLMAGVEMDADFSVLMKKLLGNGLMATKAGDNTLRLTPPLIAGPDEAALCVEKIDQVIRKGEF